MFSHRPHYSLIKLPFTCNDIIKETIIVKAMKSFWKIPYFVEIILMNCGDVDLMKM
jgi:hypothetical protein